MKLENIIDLEKYPIHKTKSYDYKKLVKKYRKDLDEIGCCCLPNFVLDNSVNRMKDEVNRNLKKTYWTKDKHNPYFSVDDNKLPTDHPKRIFQERNSGYINSDDLEENSDLRFLYDQDETLKFISDCLGVHPLYKWADPLGKNPYGIMDSDHYFPWHFDGNEFTTSILIQEAEQGGLFEYCPNIRSKENENFNKITKILKGDRSNVKTIKLRPGDLQIFKGRFSMHRVTRIEGNRSRYIALPCYVKDPYRVNKPEHCKQVYGKVMPIHFERANIEVDGLND